MSTTYIHEGNSIDYTPAADVAAGDVVVQGELVGVAKLDIKANTLGALAVAGVFDFPKAIGLGKAIAAGADVYWDATATEATTDDATGANKKIGRVVADATDNDTTVRVRMSQ
jgi:predicted RecA/RadA family phage recombinase